MGERGGVVVMHRTRLKSRCSGFDPHLWHPLEYWFIPRNRWLRPDMTEKLLTVTLNYKTRKQGICVLYALILRLGLGLGLAIPSNSCM